MASQITITRIPTATPVYVVSFEGKELARFSQLPMAEAFANLQSRIRKA